MGGPENREAPPSRNSAERGVVTERVVQQQLIMTTEGNNGCRSRAVGWSAEDPSHFVPGGGHEQVGRSPGYRSKYCYSTPLAALADGWRLLGTPKRVKNMNGRSEDEWWFVREVLTDTPRPGVA